MAIIHVTEATGGLPNSGRLSGTDGDLVGILDVALPLNGWAIEFTSGNDRVYRPGSGNRFRLCVRDQAAISGSAGLATVRAAENASAVTTYVDPFPTVAKIADGSSTWLKSNTVNTTPRNFDIYVAPTWMAMFTNFSSATNVWEFAFFGDVPPALTGDSYNTLCVVRNATGVALSATWSGSVGTLGNACYNLARSYDGTVKSTTGGVVSSAGATSFGNNSGAAAQALLGPSTGIDRAKMITLCTGSTTTVSNATIALQNRAYIPNLWLPLHGGRGALNSRDTFVDSAYNPSASFKVFTLGNVVGSGFVVIEETDTWSPPSG